MHGEASGSTELEAQEPNEKTAIVVALPVIPGFSILNDIFRIRYSILHPLLLLKNYIISGVLRASIVSGHHCIGTFCNCSTISEKPGG